MLCPKPLVRLNRAHRGSEGRGFTFSSARDTKTSKPLKKSGAARAMKTRPRTMKNDLDYSRTLYEKSEDPAKKSKITYYLWLRKD